MSTARRIVVVGGGPAGVAAALAARQQDAAAEVVLINDEHHEPYEKPPLSKAVLTGKAAAHDAPIAGPKGVVGSGVVLRGGTRVTAIDRAARAVVMEGGERIAYDALVLATGSINRVLPMFPPGRKGIYYLRTEAEARALKMHLDQAKLDSANSLIVVGGGLIGLEVAASAAELGVRTTVIEIAPRILARVSDEETSALVHERHRARGVDIRVGTAVSALREMPDGRFAVVTGNGEIAADLIVVGTGAAPDDTLAKAAGLAVEDGINVDDHGRTNDPAIFAAGDCTRFPGPHGPVRLENWRHAQEHGAIAGRNAAGGDVAYNVAPSFWSEQFDMYIQGTG
jgi:NADPH-dependent 2,4-dienoyl-CoA reductase/sulfur reductase-like enzyme